MGQPTNYRSLALLSFKLDRQSLKILVANDLIFSNNGLHTYLQCTCVCCAIGVYIIIVYIVYLIRLQYRIANNVLYTYTCISTATVVSVYEALLAVADANQDLKVTVTEVAKGVGITAVSTAAFGLLLGPPGLAVGGAVGGMLGYAASHNYKPLSQVLREMNDDEKKRLLEAAKEEAKRIGLGLLTDATLKALSSDNVKRLLLGALKSMGYNV